MGAWTVIPTGKRVVYHVANDNGKLLITSKQGSVEVSNGQEKRVVPEGNSVEIIYDHKKKKSAFALSPGNGKFALTVGAAVAAAGVILLRPGSSATKPRTAISPVQP
ncbi:MAG TPA: hypothetical protein VD837_19275 [Terriglobales bacterium]|nr:hypothetical protein [Terriglobales bacterium]